MAPRKSDSSDVVMWGSTESARVPSSADHTRYTAPPHAAAAAAPAANPALLVPPPRPGSLGFRPFPASFVAHEQQLVSLRQMRDNGTLSDDAYFDAVLAHTHRLNEAVRTGRPQAVAEAVAAGSAATEAVAPLTVVAEAPLEGELDTLPGAVAVVQPEVVQPDMDRSASVQEPVPCTEATEASRGGDRPTPRSCIAHTVFIWCGWTPCHGMCTECYRDCCRRGTTGPAQRSATAVPLPAVAAVGVITVHAQPVSTLSP